MELEALQEVALQVASDRSQAVILDKIVRGLRQEKGVALVRIWLRLPGVDCHRCAFRSECPQQVDCLHLMASAGQSHLDPQLRWDSLDGRFRRFPLHVRKVGHVGGTGEALLLNLSPESESPEDWMADPTWIEQEKIQAFAGQPLVFRNQVLGVLALFHRKPVDQEEFRWLRTFADHAAVSIANARAFEEVECLRNQLELERDYLREEVKTAQHFTGMVGASPALKRIAEQIHAVGPTEASVLIEGESGTGKELVACAIHDQSLRASAPLVRVNCASIPHGLFESEFFGHTKGAFTGAAKERPGRFAIAEGGSLFLDEIGEIPLELQGKLLRVLQEGQYSRVGEDRVRTSNVRILAATNRDLQQEVKAGRFRQDLYYRLSVFPISIPPLRERKEDIIPLAIHFLEQLGGQRNVATPGLSRRNVRELEAYSWPGNARELRNVLERSLILSAGKRLSFDLAASGPEAPVQERNPREWQIKTESEMQADQRTNLIAALEACDWKVSGPEGAAALLGIKATTLNSRMKKMAIRRPRKSPDGPEANL
ncbi:MAG: GAF domain-containing protein [Planctomycetota bacterium]|nr:MAG: GAF domain-containing protein [Planctomycetota bacterium]